MIVRVIVLVFSIVCGTGARGGELVAHLRATPPSTLPGLPVSFIVTMTNNSSSQAVMFDAATLEVQAEEGEPFVPFWNGGQSEALALEPLVDTPEEHLMLAAGSSVERWAAMPRLIAGPPFFFDSRLNRPGRYAVRMMLFEHTTPPRPVFTNWVTLVIRTPEGVDAEAWQILQDAAGSDWTVERWIDKGFTVASAIVDRHPDSGYYPYALLLSPSAVSSDSLEKALATRTDDPVFDYLMMRLGGMHDRARSDAFWQGKLTEAEASARKALEIVNDLVATTKHEFVRQQALEYLKRLPDPKSLRPLYEYDRRNAPPAPEPVMPFVQCADRTADRIVVRFGYSNPNAPAKRIDVGRSNSVAPGAPDRGQPRFFEPGRREHVFATEGAAKAPPSWTLDGSTARVAADTPSCGAARAPVRPIVECVNATNDAAVAFFGYENPNRFVVMIPIGDANRFEGDADRGQPQVFQTGRVQAAFHVNVKDAPAAWTLDGKTAHASRGAAPPCPR